MANAAGTASESIREEAESEGELWGDGGAIVGSSASPHRLKRAEVRGIHGGHALGHGRHAQRTRQPLWHFAEHVASNKVTDVGHDFGLVAGRIWTWAQKQSCNQHNALHFLFRVPSH
jgi:hypothetical protein